MMSKAGVAVAVLAGVSYGQTAHPVMNADSALIVQFQKRVADYLQLRKNIEAHMPPLKSTASVDRIEHHEKELGDEVRIARRNARQGDIFTPEIAGEIRRLIGIAMHPDGKNIRQSLRHSEPVQLHLKVNDRYPHRMPLQSTPPSLLENLPMLPPEMEYRVTGPDLVLLDAKANLIVDLIPGVFS
jgi:hypothetical protein